MFGFKKAQQVIDDAGRAVDAARRQRAQDELTARRQQAKGQKK